jgi:lambda family phage portal protein
MTERNKMSNLFRRSAATIDELVGIVSPRRQFNRLQFRAAYDAIAKSRLNIKRTGLGGTADTQLDTSTLDSLREIHRDMMRNNPIVKGMLLMERDEVVGEGPVIRAKTADKDWNKRHDDLWWKEMVEKPVDITGQFNFPQILGMQFLSYRRDGDSAVIFFDDYLQMIEGDQIGTPYGLSNNNPDYRVVNGKAYSRLTGALVGYYIGEPSKEGFYIKADSYKKYPAEQVYFMFSPERISQSRGEPALTSSVKFIDQLSKYIDAEVVAAAVNACFTVFIAKRENQAPAAYTKGINSTGLDEDDNKLEKIQPGTIMYGEPGESAQGIGNVRPAEVFDPFVMRMLSFIARPLCIPLMLVTLDFAGATFMNARIAYQAAKSKWMIEQAHRLTPLANRGNIWFVERMIQQKKLAVRQDMFECSIRCKRWPYINPVQEEGANETAIKNRTLSRQQIIAAKGEDYEETTKELEEEDKRLPKTAESVKSEA